MEVDGRTASRGNDPLELSLGPSSTEDRFGLLPEFPLCGFGCTNLWSEEPTVRQMQSRGTRDGHEALLGVSGEAPCGW